MAEQIEKVISVKVEGVDKALANLQKVENTAAAIRQELAKTGKSLPEAEIRRMAKEIANADVQAKKLGRSLKEAFRNVGKESLGSAGIAGGVAGLFGGFIGGGVATLIDKATGALLEWITAESDAQKAARELQEANDAAIESFAQEKVTLEVNTEILLDNTASTDDKKRALDELQELYPAYFDNLTVEELSVDNVTDAYNRATDAINLKIKAETFQKLAVEKLTQVEKDKFKLEQSNNALAQLRNQYDDSWYNTIQQISGVLPNLLTVAEAAQADLNDEISKGNVEYEAYLEKLKEIEKQLKSQEDKEGKAADKAKNAQANAEKAEQRRKEAIKEGVTDLESAIRRLNEVQSTASIQERKDLRELIKLYGDKAIAEIEAKEKVDGLTGRTEEEIKDQNISIEKQIKDIKLIADVEASRVKEYVNLGLTLDGIGKTIFQFRDSKGTILDPEPYKKIIKELLDSADNFDEFLVKARTSGFEFPQLDPIEKNIRDFTKTFNDNITELNGLKKQQAATGFDVIQIQSKMRAAILADETLEIEQQQELVKKKLEQLEKNPELIAKAYEDAGITEVEAIENEKRIVIEAREKSLRDIQADFDSFAEEVRRLGLGTIGGDVNEGFTFIPLDAANIQSKEFVTIVKDLNKRVELEFKKSQLGLENARFAAFDRAIRAAANASKSEVRQLRADLKTKELEQDSYYDDVLESNRRFAERVVAQNGELGEQDINFIRSQKEEQIKLRQEATDIELKIEVDKQQKALASLEDGSEAYLTVLQEFENKKLEIINKGQSDLKKIDLDFENIIMSTESKDKGIKNFNDFWAQAQPIIQNIAQAIDNIFQIIINKQQELVNDIQERLSQVDQQLQETLSRISELEADLEGKRSGRREAILRGIQEEREQEERLTAQKIALAQRLAREEEKLAKKRKAAAITQAIINGAVAITQLNASIVDPTPVQAFRIAANIALAAVIGTQIALIASQKFAEGGFTSDGQGGKRDETGHIPVGVVHNDEYVVPKWMVKSPKYRPIIDSLEGARKRGFAEGGFTTPDYAALSDSVSPSSNNKVMSIVQRSVDAAIALSERPIIANPVEFTNVERTVARRVQATTIGG